MKLFKQIRDLQFYLAKIKSAGRETGFIPTMGALHSGHLSLLQMSIEKCDTTICSIFVNPTQFNDKKDFDNYPVTIGNDIRLLEKAGCDVLFLPQANEIYPQGTANLRHYELGGLENILEGKYRPGHFQGVCQVVHRLLDIVNPNYLFLGQKDYQQCMVIARLTELIKSTAKIIIGATYREASGLAMSSRNQRLTAEQKGQAAAIYQMLSYIQSNLHHFSASELIAYATNYLLSNGFHKVDYVTIANAATLQPVTDKLPEQAVALVAAFIGEVRLIDNMVMTW